MKDPAFFYNPIVILILSIYTLYKFTLPIIKLVNEIIEDFFKSDYYNTNIIIPYHRKFIMDMVQLNQQTKLYTVSVFCHNSLYKKYHIEKISSLIEIINFENTKYIDINTSDFILIPKDKQKILLSEKYDLYLEVIYDTQNEIKNEKTIQVMRQHIL